RYSSSGGCVHAGEVGGDAADAAARTVAEVPVENVGLHAEPEGQPKFRGHAHNISIGGRAGIDILRARHGQKVRQGHATLDAEGKWLGKRCRGREKQQAQWFHDVGYGYRGPLVSSLTREV